MSRLSRLWESFKSLLIVLLLCSALYLAVSLIGQLVSGQSLNQRISAAMGWTPSELPYTQRSEHYTAAAMPLTVSLSTSLGRGSSYGDPERTAELYDLLSRWLGEALANASMPVALEKTDWQQLLSGESTTLLYAGEIPLESLAHWLGATPSNALDGLTAREITLCIDGNQLSLLLHTEHWLCLGTGLDPSGLQQVLELCRPDGSFFAIESAEYDHIDPMSLLTVSTILPLATTENPLSDGDRIDAAATLLGLNPYRDTTYTSSSGTVTITGAAGRMQVTSNGMLDFTVSADNGFTASDAEDSTLIESARALLNQLGQEQLGDATLELYRLEHEGDTVRIQFEYVLRGYPIQQNQGPAAELVYRGNQLQSLRWIARRYTTTGETQSLLSSRLAAAIIRPDSLLQAVYIDNGSALLCGWLSGLNTTLD